MAACSVRGGFGHGLVRCVPEQGLLWACSAEAVSARAARAVAEGATAAEGLELGEVLYPEEMESCDRLRLVVPLFSPQQVGAAAEYGPVTLSALLRFCRELRAALKEASPGTVCICCSSRPGKAANSLLLLGAYLVLECGWPAARAARQLLAAEEGRQAPPQRFPRPWESSLEWTEDCLTTRDCLFGLEAAVSHGWLSYKTVDVEARQQVALAFDAVPVFSVVLRGQAADSLAPRDVKVDFWVAADPVTTVLDPGPRPEPPDDELADDRTISPGLTPKSRRSGFSGDSTPSSWSQGRLARALSRSLGMGAAPKPSPPLELNVVPRAWPDEDPRAPAPSAPRAPSAEWLQRSGARTRAAAAARPLPPRGGGGLVKPNGAPALRRPADLPAVARWLREGLNCKLLVRTNFASERGLPSAGSYGDFFSRWGVQQLDMPFPDLTAPSLKSAAALVAEVAQTLHEVQTGGEDGRDCAVVVHCKAGMGRSMTSLAVLAVALVPELSAGAFFGWARLARPGSVQTRAQERFLRSLDEDGSACGCFRGGGKSASRGAALQGASPFASRP